MSLDLPAGLVADGEVVNRDGLADALKSFAADTGLPKSVRLGVANQQIVVRVIELPRIEDEKQRDAAVRFQAAEAIAMPLDEAVLDHQVAGYTEAPDGSPRMQVVVVAARRSMIEALLEAAKQAGLKPEGIDLDAFALVRMLAVATDGQPEESARVYCHLGGVSNLAIAVGTACLFTRPLAAVWDDEGAGARLADEIRLSIDYYMTQPQAKPVGEIVLSGPGSADEELVESLGVHLGLPDHGRGAARRPRPLGARRRRGPAQADRCRRARDGEGRMKAVNLIPTEQRRAQASGKQNGSSYIVHRRARDAARDGGRVRLHVQQRQGPQQQGGRREGPGRPARGRGRAARRLHELLGHQEARLASVVNVATRASTGSASCESSRA